MLGLQSFRRHFHWSERKIRLTEAADSGAWSGKRIVYDPLLTWFTFLQTHKKMGIKLLPTPFLKFQRIIQHFEDGRRHFEHNWVTWPQFANSWCSTSRLSLSEGFPSRSPPTTNTNTPDFNPLKRSGWENSLHGWLQLNPFLLLRLVVAFQFQKLSTLDRVVKHTFSTLRKHASDFLQPW